MSLAFPIKYAGLVKGSILGNRGWVTWHNRTAKISGGKPGQGGAGAVSLTYISGITVTNTSDGTPLTNGVASATVAGTYVDPNAPLVLTGAEIQSLYTDPEYMTQVGEACGSSLIAAAQNSLIADLVAGTPAYTQTLPAGSANFKVVSNNEGALLQLMGRVVTEMMARFGKASTELAIAMNAVSFGNFIGLRATGINNPVLMPDGYYTFMGAPIFPIPGTGASGDNITGGATNFGAASNPCCFVTMKDSVLFVADDPYIHGGGPIAASDGTTKFITKMPYAHALVSTFFTEVLNSTS